MTSPISNQLYTIANGATSTGPFITIVKDRAPAVTDVGDFKVGQRWLDSSDDYSEYFLAGFTTTTGVYQANWVSISPNPDVIQTITGNSGGAIGPDASGNVGLVGDGTIINVVGASNTLTVTPSATIPTSFTTDSGTATPALNILQVLGGTGCSTSGATNAVTVNLDASVPLSFPTQSGTATPAANVLTINGSSAGGTASTGLGSTVTLATTFAAWSGTVLTIATPGGGTTALSIISSGAVTAPVQLKCGTGLDYTFGAGDIAPFRISQSNSGNGTVAYLYNPSSSAGANANLSIVCDGAGLGAFTSWITLTAPATTNLWQGGIYASDSSFRLSKTAIGTTDALIINTSNNAIFLGSVQAASFTVASGGPTITSGSGAPASTQPKGSLYLRTDGSGVNDRAYVATDSAGTWTAIVTVA